MAEINNWIYYSGLYQTIVELLDRLHQSPQVIPNTTRKLRINHEKSLQNFNYIHSLLLERSSVTL